jgi:hypothetical protein
LSQSQPRQSKLFQAFQSLSKKNKGKKKGFQGKKTLIFFDFLGYLRAIRAFSMRYGRISNKNLFRGSNPSLLAFPTPATGPGDRRFSLLLSSERYHDF